MVTDSGLGRLWRTPPRSLSREPNKHNLRAQPRGVVGLSINRLRRNTGLHNQRDPVYATKKENDLKRPFLSIPEPISNSSEGWT